MKLINLRPASLLTAICSALLSLLGFGCSSMTPEEPCMYGMPTGKFEIKGSVTTEEGNAVADAEIRVTPTDIPSGIYSLETTTTDSDGLYSAKGGSHAASELKVVCVPSDPGLEADSVIVKLRYNKNDKEHDGFWYVGDAKETVDFKLKTKSTEEE